MECENCGKSNNGEYGSGRFCNAKCARGFATKHKRKEINNKVSKSLSGRNEIYELTCLVCGSKRQLSIKRRNQKTCSKICGSVWPTHPDNSNSKNRRSQLQKQGIKSASIQKDNRRSKNEILFYELCKERWKDTLNNYPMFNGWDADIIIPSLKVAIMWNGKWHYEKITEKHSVKQVQNRDKIKKKEIESFGYKCYIIKDMGKYNPDFVKLSFKEFCISLINELK